VLTADEIKHTTARVEQLSKMDLIGQAVTRAVSEIRFIVKHATLADLLKRYPFGPNRLVGRLSEA